MTPRIAAPRGRTRLLASVRSVAEARVALAGGADIIDVKEPAGGALGAAPLPEIAAIAQAIGGRRPVSATIGDCPCDEAPERVSRTAGTGVDFVKMGLFGSPSPAALASLARLASDGVRLIAVMFADRAPDWAEIPRLAEAGFAGVMLDTADKGRGGLRAHLSPRDLAAFLAEARAQKLLAGLAGSLGAGDAAHLLPLAPDVLGFRGALCSGDRRGGALELARVEAICAIIRHGSAAEPAPAA